MFNRGGGGGAGPGGFFDNFFGAPMINPNARFDVQYQCFPVSFLGRDDLESGNKILLPPSALEHLARLNISYPMLFELSNGGRRTHAGVLEFVAEEGTCYLPYWCMQNLLLREGDLVRVMNTSLPKGSFVKLRPVTSEWLQIHNPRAVLETTLRNFATLTVGDCIAITYNKKVYEIEIIECKPANAISIIETDVNVDFAAPKDYVEPTAVQTSAAPSALSGGADYLRPSPAVSAGAAGSGVELDAESINAAGGKARLFSGGGNRLDGKSVKLSNVVTPRDSGSDIDEEPWKNDRIQGGARSTAPYGYNTGNMSATAAYKPPTHKTAKALLKTELFAGSGETLE